MTVEEKALELVAENRVVLPPFRSSSMFDEAIVAGHHDHYRVLATKQGVECSCPARKELCAHALAAMVAWAEKEAVTPPW